MNATQAKDRLYSQLAASLKNMSRAVGQTADLFEQLQTDLDAMRVLAGTHAAQFMTVAAELSPEADGGANTEATMVGSASLENFVIEKTL
ncbi:uncharacterized protein F5891DRAFT_1044480 [Suillus fuscotomentosus]|uniref:Uncharacterized protein n=3 Tax=Suillus TaxID=5379 RepID=A0AAD4E227_9AGAM|nr:uncharacterized protein F5891DRAFT_1048811 [Suillus fuscotomentosus]XP_041223676.1 uncharacterized protein F5891DRAFT_1044480 [Suillus fuscotomentosus]KAG1897508.1 hypothetical protein F5891DRAFT_1048811 [Suillus fuscotomentosus]KAG1898100.1 hypothetical protein F5891DRAFT_1044480 [Suillus fuscotomentosus]